jgi:hypothetical protein
MIAPSNQALEWDRAYIAAFWKYLNNIIINTFIIFFA